mmetsp:Transcript_46714/g.70538  ORF Transcript_46714/g.70538 Transcript_46714/m.70538 type:complete len:159 (+) Transcript_46714:267-743(+)
MGSGVSRRYKYGINTERYFKNKILPRSRELLKILSFSYRRSLYLFRLFIKIDKDKSGQISLNEFRRFFGIRKGAFLERLFCILDSDQNGTLEFNEFVVGIWNFCTNDMHLLAKVRDITDADTPRKKRPFVTGDNGIHVLNQSLTYLGPMMLFFCSVCV